MNRIALLHLVILLLCSCNKEGCDIEGGYEFIIPAELSPRQDTFKIGDTIHFVSEFKDVVPEKNTGQKYKLVNFNFFPISYIRKIDEHPTVSALDDFEVIVAPGFEYAEKKYTSGDIILEGRYSYDQRVYQLEFVLVPQEKGLYQFYHNSKLIHDYGGEQEFEGKCKSETVREILVYLNEGDDNNIDLLRHGTDTAFNNRVLNDPQEKFYEEGAYVFYVVE